MSHHDPYRPKSSVAGNSSAPKVDQPEDETTKVPSGTTKEILDWVDNDQDRAQQALEVEKSHDSPRKGLLKELNDILKDDEEE